MRQATKPTRTIKPMRRTRTRLARLGAAPRCSAGPLAAAHGGIETRRDSEWRALQLRSAEARPAAKGVQRCGRLRSRACAPPRSRELRGLHEAQCFLVPDLIQKLT